VAVGLVVAVGVALCVAVVVGLGVAVNVAVGVAVGVIVGVGLGVAVGAALQLRAMPTLLYAAVGDVVPAVSVPVGLDEVSAWSPQYTPKFVLVTNGVYSRSVTVPLGVNVPALWNWIPPRNQSLAAPGVTVVNVTFGLELPFVLRSSIGDDWFSPL
jgi:hypothetical protein